MSNRAIQLTDGTTVEPDRSGQTGRYFHKGEPVTIEQDGDKVRILNSDGSVAHEGTVAAGKVKASKHKTQTATEGGDRWTTFNAFMDVCMKHLSPVEANVWLLLFRDTKPDGLARTSSRNLAQRAGCSVRAVSHAMKLLKAATLIEVVTASTSRGSPSVFRVTMRPQRCEERLTTAKAKQQRNTVATISTVASK